MMPPMYSIPNSMGIHLEKTHRLTWTVVRDTDDWDYTAVSERLCNGDFAYRLVLEIGSFWHDGREEDVLYGTVTAVAPSMHGKEASLRALRDLRAWTDVVLGAADIYAELKGYGLGACLWQSGLQPESYEAHRAMIFDGMLEADAIESLFGFYMDRQQNLMGATGWELIRGEFCPRATEDDDE